MVNDQQPSLSHSMLMYSFQIPAINVQIVSAMAEFRYESTAREVEMAKVLQELQGTIHFVIDRLGKSQVPENTISETCRLMMPAWFVQEHGDKFQEFVVLRSTSSSIPCRVRLRIYNTPLKAPAIKFGKGWRDFATCNGLMIGDSLIFELKSLSEFEVYVFRGPTGLPTAISSSQALKDWSTDSEISQKNGNYDSSAGCSRYQHLVAERSEGLEDDLCEAVAKKRKVGEEDAVSASQHTLQNPSFIKLRLSELENVQVSSLQVRHDAQNSQGPPVDRQVLRMPFAANETAQFKISARKIDVKEEFRQAKILLPSFIQRLVEYNVQDSAGNTSGARFDVPLSFVKTHGIRLQAHVKLQGTREESKFRTVTCSYNMHQDSEERSTRPPLSLGWGDFVRDNVLRAGQELVFTLASESFFIIREVSEIVVYTR